MSKKSKITHFENQFKVPEVPERFQSTSSYFLSPPPVKTITKRTSNSVLANIIDEIGKPNTPTFASDRNISDSKYTGVGSSSISRNGSFHLSEKKIQTNISQPPPPSRKRNYGEMYTPKTTQPMMMTHSINLSARSFSDEFIVPKSPIKFPIQKVRLGKYIDDDVVNDYLDAISVDDKDDCVLLSNSHYVQSIYIAYNHENRDFKNFVYKTASRNNYADYHKWVLPLFSEAHWLMCIVYLRENQLVFFDSLNSYTTFNDLPLHLKNQIICLRLYLNTYGELFDVPSFKEKWMIHFGTVEPPQRNNWACAWYIMFIATMHKVCTHEKFSEESKIQFISVRQLRLFAQSFSQ